jgi:hypothetical protein
MTARGWMVVVAVAAWLPVLLLAQNALLGRAANPASFGATWPGCGTAEGRSAPA